METVHKTVEEKSSIQLDMAPISETPARSQRPPAPTARRPLINVLSIVRQAVLLAVIAAMSVGSYYAISHYVLQNVEVVGISMVPTLKERNHYLLNRWTYRNREPRHNDVVVIRDPSDHGFSVKRVVAVAGESIYFKGGKVYVNGKELEEPYLLPGTHTFTYSQAREQFIMCGKGQYYVLGDNRPVSIDSRSYGPVPREDILGLVLVN